MINREIILLVYRLRVEGGASVGEFGDKHGNTSPCIDRQQLTHRSLFHKLPACQGDVETDLRSSLRKSPSIYTPRRVYLQSVPTHA